MTREAPARRASEKEQRWCIPKREMSTKSDSRVTLGTVSWHAVSPSVLVHWIIHVSESRPRLLTRGPLAKRARYGNDEL